MNATKIEPAPEAMVNGSGRDRALHVLHVLAPAPVGGLESVVRLLAGGQSRCGLDVHVAVVVTPEDEQPHPFIEAARTDGLDVRVIVAGARSYVREYRALRDLCRTLSVNVLHSHGFRPDVVAAAAGRSLGLATVSTVHGFTANGWRGRLYEAVQCRALARADAVVAVSAQQVGRLRRAGVRPERLHVIPNALELRAAVQSRSAARRKLNLPQDAFVAGWLGRIGHEKGPDIMAAAAATLVAEGMHVSIIGEGPLRRQLQHEMELAGLGEGVTWHGRLDDAAGLLPAFDVFVLSSRTEGTPMALLEAMAAGVPLVVTRVGGVPDVVGPAEALLVPSGDPDALASAVLSVRDGPDAAAKRVDAARQRLTKRHAVDPWLRRHAEVYAGALAENALSARMYHRHRRPAGR